MALAGRGFPSRPKYIRPPLVATGGIVPPFGGRAVAGNSSLYPTIKVEIAFASPAPDSSPVWDDVTPYVRGLSVGRGRGEIFERFDTGVLRLMLDNRDRRFDPSYTSGAYYPNVKPRRPVRVRAQWDSTIYGLFRGNLEDWPQTWQEKGKDALIQVEGVDLFGILNRVEFADDFEAPSERSDVRVGRILDLIDAPVALRSLQTGYAVVPAVTRPIEQQQSTQSNLTEAAKGASPLKGTKLLAHLQDVQDAEGGQLYANRDGVVTFENRHHRNINERTSRATFGDTPGELRYADVDIFYGDQVWNDGRVSGGSGVEQRYVNQPSVDEFYATVWSKSVALADDNEAEALAQYVVETHKDPLFRCPSMQLAPASAPSTLWPEALGREVSHHITVNRRPMGSSLLTFEQAIEGVAHTITTGTWVTSMEMSRLDLNDYWVLGEADSSLGVNTVLAY